MAVDDDDPIAKLRSPEGAKQFAANVARRDPELAKRATRRGVELQALAKGASSQVELECLEAVYAYELAMSQRDGKTKRASRTWPMIERDGILPAVEHIVTKPEPSIGYTTLVQMGIEDKAFEAVVLRHPSHFSAKAVSSASARLGTPQPISKDKK